MSVEAVAGRPGIYVGKYTSDDRPRHAYRRNVERILNDQLSHHRSGKFRRVHHALAAAVKDKRQITLTLLRNGTCGPELRRLERELIRSERANLNGPPDLP